MASRHIHVRHVVISISTRTVSSEKAARKSPVGAHEFTDGKHKTDGATAKKAQQTSTANSMMEFRQPILCFVCYSTDNSAKNCPKMDN
jgi:succinate dehydrogenase/fumarate reductase-like Fe-S protein